MKVVRVVALIIIFDTLSTFYQFCDVIFEIIPPHLRNIIVLSMSDFGFSLAFDCYRSFAIKKIILDYGKHPIANICSAT